MNPRVGWKVRRGWRGLFKIVEKLGDVTYRIGGMKGKKKYRVVHVIVLKRFVEREEMVRRITLLIDKDDVGIGEQN